MICEKRLTKKQKRDAIYEELIKQLHYKRAETSFFVSLVNDYMMHYDLKERLAKEAKGKTVTYIDERNNERINPIIKELQNESKLMMQILKELDLKTSNVAGGEEDADYYDADG